MDKNEEQRSVHPSSDKTWRNTSYDLTKMPLEAARVLYRTRLELRATDAPVEPWQAARARGNELRSDLFFEVGKELRDCEQIVDVARRAFKDRLVILDSACASARDYRGDPAEMFEGLVAAYEHLWPMRFGPNGDANKDEDAFHAASGFGLSFHESKQTRRNPRLAKMREVVYKGKAYDMSPHIKGGDKRRGFLRIHFFFDSEHKLVVIGHCGNHMETDGTAKL